MKRRRKRTETHETGKCKNFYFSKVQENNPKTTTFRFFNEAIKHTRGIKYEKVTQKGDKQPLRQGTTGN